jgi:hypothetical protein
VHPCHAVIENERKMTLDRVLLTALVDRWRPETDTFHLRWGKIAPTLQDVSCLLGLSLAGDPIGPLRAPKDWVVDLIRRFNKICGEVACLDIEPSHGPKYAWLKEFYVF